MVYIDCELVISEIQLDDIVLTDYIGKNGQFNEFIGNVHKTHIVNGVI